MALSNAFLKEFTVFVEKYKTRGYTSFLSWSKEVNHQGVSQSLEDLLTVVTNNKEHFHDASIIEYLSPILINMARTNPYLFLFWSELLANESIIKNYQSIGSPHIQVNSEGLSSAKIINDLQNIASEKQQAANLMQNAHNRERGLLNEKIKKLDTRNIFLETQNRQLTEQLHNQEALAQLRNKIQTARTQLMSCFELLNTIDELSRGADINDAIRNHGILCLDDDELSPRDEEVETPMVKTESPDVPPERIRLSNSNAKSIVTALPATTVNASSPSVIPLAPTIVSEPVTKATANALVMLQSLANDQDIQPSAPIPATEAPDDSKPTPPPIAPPAPVAKTQKLFKPKKEFSSVADGYKKLEEQRALNQQPNNSDEVLDQKKNLQPSY